MIGLYEIYFVNLTDQNLLDLVISAAIVSSEFLTWKCTNIFPLAAPLGPVHWVQCTVNIALGTVDTLLYPVSLYPVSSWATNYGSSALGTVHSEHCTGHTALGTMGRKKANSLRNFSLPLFKAISLVYDTM